MSNKSNKNSRPFIGIDFGTTKTMVAEYDPIKRLAKVCKLGRGGNEMPTSMYAPKDGEVLFGDDADDEGIHDTPNHVRRFKMLLGEETKTQFKGRVVNPTNLASEFLSHLKSRLESAVCHRTVDYVVLTVPAMFGLAQREELQKAAKRAGFKRVELLYEPVAAGIAYCEHNTDRSKTLRFLVADWGGGTLDLAVVERNGSGECKVLLEYIGGSGEIGGEDLDDDLWIAVSDMLKSSGKPPLESQPVHERGKYRRELTRTKESLSVRTQATASFTLEGGKLERIPFERDKLEGIFHEKISAGVDQVAKLLGRCQTGGCPLDFVLLVGGTSQIPMIKQLFEETLQIDCRVWSEGRDAIALGAAIRANELWGSDVPLLKEPQADPPAESSDESNYTVSCPHCDGQISDVTSTGDWPCPWCRKTFEVACSCPECGQEVEIEEWGKYPCPARSCGAEFDAWECATVSVPSISVECPHCGDEITEVTSTGDWKCPCCKKAFEVGCSCPECGKEVKSEEWGTYSCRTRGCRTKFDTRECAWVAIPNMEHLVTSTNGLALSIKKSPICAEILARAPDAHPEIDFDTFIEGTHLRVPYLLRIINRTQETIECVRILMKGSNGQEHSIEIDEISPGERGALNLTTLVLEGWAVEPGDQFTAVADGITPANLKVTREMCKKLDGGKALKEKIPCIVTVRKATFSSNFVLRIKNVTKRPLTIRKFDSPAGSLSSETTIDPQCWEEIGRFELTEGRNFAAGEEFRISFSDGRKLVGRGVAGIIAEGNLKGNGGLLTILGGLALAAAFGG